MGGKQHFHFTEEPKGQGSETLAKSYPDHQWQCWDSNPEQAGSGIHAIDHTTAPIAGALESERISLLFTCFQICHHPNQHLDLFLGLLYLPLSSGAEAVVIHLHSLSP